MQILGMIWRGWPLRSIQWIAYYFSHFSLLARGGLEAMYRKSRGLGTTWSRRLRFKMDVRPQQSGNNRRNFNCVCPRNIIGFFFCFVCLSDEKTVICQNEGRRKRTFRRLQGVSPLPSPDILKTNNGHPAKKSLEKKEKEPLKVQKIKSVNKTSTTKLNYKFPVLQWKNAYMYAHCKTSQGYINSNIYLNTSSTK